MNVSAVIRDKRGVFEYYGFASGGELSAARLTTYFRLIGYVSITVLHRPFAGFSIPQAPFPELITGLCNSSKSVVWQHIV